MKLTPLCYPYKVVPTEKLLGGKAYRLLEAIPFTNEHGEADEVPKGFVFDGFSIPFVRRFLSEGGWNIAEAALHDWQYLTGTPRKIADKSLALNMKRSGEHENAIVIVGVGITWIGWVSYARYTKRRDRDPDLVYSRIAGTKERAEFIARTITV